MTGVGTLLFSDNRSLIGRIGITLLMHQTDLAFSGLGSDDREVDELLFRWYVVERTYFLSFLVYMHNVSFL